MKVKLGLCTMWLVVCVLCFPSIRAKAATYYCCRLDNSSEVNIYNRPERNLLARIETEEEQNTLECKLSYDAKRDELRMKGVSADTVKLYVGALYISGDEDFSQNNTTTIGTLNLKTNIKLDMDEEPSAKLVCKEVEGGKLLPEKGISHTSGGYFKNFNIQQAMVTINESNYIYDGRPKQPSVTVTYCGEKIPSVSNNATNYTVSYENNINAGQASVLVKDQGGRVCKKTFAINRATVGSVSVMSTPVYNGTKQLPGIVVKDGQGNVVGSSAYAVAPKNNYGYVNAGVGYVIVSVNSNNYYPGQWERSFNIAKATVNDKTMVLTSPIYNKKAQVPSVASCKDTQGNNIPTSAFSVSATNNVNAGNNASATITINSSNFYSGKWTKKFTIQKAATNIECSSTVSLSYNAEKDIAPTSNQNESIISCKLADSSDKKITVSKGGLVKVLTKNTGISSNVIVVQPESNNYKRAEKTVTIRLVPAVKKATATSTKKGVVYIEIEGDKYATYYNVYDKKDGDLLKKEITLKKEDGYKKTVKLSDLKTGSVCEVNVVPIVKTKNGDLWKGTRKSAKCTVK